MAISVSKIVNISMGVGEMTTLEAIAETVRLAKEKDSIMYLCETPNAYRFVPHWEKDWIFRAWPGGRKELSRRGLEIVEETK